MGSLGFFLPRQSLSQSNLTESKEIMMSTATVNQTGNTASSTDIEKTAPHNQTGNVVPRENSSNGIGASINSEPQASKNVTCPVFLSQR